MTTREQADTVDAHEVITEPALDATVDAAGSPTLEDRQVEIRTNRRPSTAAQDRSQPTVVGDVAATVREVLLARQAGQRPQKGDRYRPLRELGRGGMGRVDEVRDAWLGRRIARKTLLRDDDVVRARFSVEALVTAQLDHPGVPTVYELHTEDQDEPSYTMQLVEGTALSKILRDCADLPARLRLVPAVARVAQTLAFAHAHGVVHRDIKPDNVIIGSHGEVVLLDWGIAKVRGLADAQSSAADPETLRLATEDVALTAHGAVLGTPAYMAPEQARGEIPKIDERTDVFALGAMLYHVLSGRPPYDGKTVSELIVQAQAAQPTPIDHAAKEAAEGLRAVVRKAMQPDPAQRHANAGEFAADLENFLSQAMAAKPNRGVERFANATGTFGLIMAVLLAAATWAATPTLREMGFAGLGTLFFLVPGLVIGAVEWQTRGRYHLMALGLCVAALTLGQSLIGTVLGLGRVYTAMSKPEVLADAAKFREYDAIGHYEALGNIPFGLAMTLLQLAVLAVAAYRARRHPA